MVTGKKCGTIGLRGALLLSIAVTGLLSGCSFQSSASPAPMAAPQPQMPVAVARTQGYSAPGVVNYIWEEPMANVVEVPPGLDPEGIYYRPAHQEVVEIRQGRWKYYKDQAEK